MPCGDVIAARHFGTELLTPNLESGVVSSTLQKPRKFCQGIGGESSDSYTSGMGVFFPFFSRATTV